MEVLNGMEVLHEQDDLAIVKLGQKVEADGTDSVVEQFISYFSSGEVKILRTDLHYVIESCRMTHKEIDNFVAAWALYKADQLEKAEAEAKRQADVEAEAYQLAEKCNAIHLEKRNDQSSPCWTVDLPDFGWFSGRVYGADDLLDTVKQAIEYCQPIQEAYGLSKDYPINFNHKKGTALWHITINNLFGEWAEQKSIVAVVQQAIEKYNQYQDKLAKKDLF